MLPRRKLCLIIEDQKSSIQFIKNLVEAAFPGTETVVARDLKSARLWLQQRIGLENKEDLGLVFVDLGLPDGNGVEIIRSVSQLEPEALPIVVSIYDDDAFLFKALAAGAKGYLLKGGDSSSLVEILKRIENNEPPLSPSIARKLLSYFQQENPVKESREILSPRENETLVLLSRGLTVSEAAKKMNLSPQTVAGYVKNIYQKLHVSNRVEMLQEAHRLRLL